MVVDPEYETPSPVVSQASLICFFTLRDESVGTILFFAQNISNLFFGHLFPFAPFVSSGVPSSSPFPNIFTRLFVPPPSCLHTNNPPIACVANN